MTDAMVERMRMVTLLASAALTADWASKSWALAALDEPRPVGGLLLEVERNAVFAFSAGDGLAPAFVVVGLRLLALAALVLLARRVVRHGMRYAVGMGLVIGGGIGNAADLLFRSGGVVDFIGAGPYVLELGGAPWRFHVVFNGADVALLLGIALLAPLIRDWALSLQARIARWEARWLEGGA